MLELCPQLVTLGFLRIDCSAKKLAKQTKQYSYKEDISHLIDVHTSFQCNNALCFTDFKRQPSARLRASKRRVGAAPSFLRSFAAAVAGRAADLVAVANISEIHSAECIARTLGDACLLTFEQGKKIST